MPPHAHIAHGEPARSETLGLDGSETHELQAGTPLADEAEAIVAIELNFNAYADNVPPTKHAKRVATHHDPSIQDFADQALELATLRAELKRLHRDYDSLQHTMRVRDAQVQALREEVSALRAHARSSRVFAAEQSADDLPSTACELQSGRLRRGEDGQAPERRALAAHDTTIVDDSLSEPELSSTHVLPPNAFAASGTVIASGAIGDGASALSAPGRKLIPVGHDGQAVLLNRDIITIGRTRQSDVCIPSRGVSRDHARLLVSANGVTLFDRDSANGCFVNDESVKRQKLKDGDLVRIGDRSYRFADDPAAYRVRSR